MELRREGNRRQAMQEAVLNLGATAGNRKVLEADLGPPDDVEWGSSFVGERATNIPRNAVAAVSYVVYRDPEGVSGLVIFYLDAQNCILRAQMEAR
ncbi:hypothetical protein EON81_18325 [bacterium]|nr:MAG: hypothetical protein EON81_18325 [bacterium]